MLSNFTLLYVEDDNEMQEYMKSLLQDEFKEFYQAFNGQEGLDMFEKHQPDIILSDINMPLMDGFDMAQKVKSINYDQVILFFTALTDYKDIQKAIDIHINGFINKPLSSIDDFFKYIESKVNVLKLKNTQKELEKLRVEKEKSDFIIGTIHEIAHHWKQPLNTISIIAGVLSYKYQNNIELTQKDLEDMEIIIEQVSKLASVIEDIEAISTDKDVDVDKISNILKISNPIYE